MKKLIAIAVALIFVGAPILVSCSDDLTPETPKKTKEEVAKDSLKPGWSYIPYENTPF